MRIPLLRKVFDCINYGLGLVVLVPAVVTAVVVVVVVIVLLLSWLLVRLL